MLHAADYINGLSRLITLTLLIFSLTLFAAVLLSNRADRTLLSTSVLFLAVGFVAGNSTLDLLKFTPGTPLASIIAELALVSVLFTDGMRLNVRELREVGHLPGRALLFGLPLTLVIITLIAHGLFQLTWLESLLVGAVLSPTDPVFASLIIEQTVVPRQLRRLLNVESGLNDGLVLPIVVILIQLISNAPVNPLELFAEIALGVVLGIIIPVVALAIGRLPIFAVETKNQPLNAFTIGVLVLVLAEIFHANVFLAVFCAGITIASISEETRAEFRQFGELIAQLLKLVALFFFGMLLEPQLFSAGGVTSYLFAVLILFIARPLAIFMALWGSKLAFSEQLTVAWFGPKGFASIFYTLLIWRRGIDGGGKLFQILTLTIIISIIAHSSTDIFFTRWFTRRSSLDEPTD